MIFLIYKYRYDWSNYDKSLHAIDLYIYIYIYVNTVALKLLLAQHK